MLKVTATTAVQLSSAQLSKLQKGVEAKYNQKVEVKTIVDPSILGGVVLTIDSRQLDSSVKGKLQVLKQQLLAQVMK